MAGPWSSGFSIGFGTLLTIVSNRDYRSMQILGYNNVETLLYDFDNSQSFFVLSSPPETIPATLFAVSPLFASNWFRAQAPVTVVYNPFQGSFQQFSNIAGPA